MPPVDLFQLSSDHVKLSIEDFVPFILGEREVVIVGKSDSCLSHSLCFFGNSGFGAGINAGGQPPAPPPGINRFRPNPEVKYIGFLA